jgi:hypothetical protein
MLRGQRDWRAPKPSRIYWPADQSTEIGEAPSALGLADEARDAFRMAFAEALQIPRPTTRRHAYIRLALAVAGKDAAP